METLDWKKFETYYSNQGDYAVTLWERVKAGVLGNNPALEIDHGPLLLALVHQYNETVTQFDL
jgi:hypothetical protein